MTREEAAGLVTMDYVYEFANKLLYNQRELANSRHRLYHGVDCPTRRGDDYCTCDRRKVCIRQDLVGVFLRVAVGIRDGEDDRWIGDCASPLHLERRRLRHPGGRPTKYSHTLALRIGLLVVMGGQTVKTALEICRVSRYSLSRWRRDHYLLDSMLRKLEDSREAFPRRYCKRVLRHGKMRREKTRRVVYGT